MLIMYVLLTPFSSKPAGKTPEQIVQEANAQVKEESIQDAKKMMDSGEKIVILNVVSMKDGLNVWKRPGYPAESGISIF